MRPERAFALAALAWVAASISAAAQQPAQPMGQYPEAALEQGLSGIVGLDCMAREDGGVDCTVVTEMPGGMGFGDAALAMSQDWRPTQENGTALAPGTQFQRAVQFTPAPEPSVHSTAGRVVVPWEERPSARDFARRIPDVVLARAIDSEVLLDCVVNAERRLDCQIASENPQGYGFGEGALRAVRAFRIAPQMPTGENTVGGRVRIPMTLAVHN